MMRLILGCFWVTVFLCVNAAPTEQPGTCTEENERLYIAGGDYSCDALIDPDHPDNVVTRAFKNRVTIVCNATSYFGCCFTCPNKVLSSNSNTEAGSDNSTPSVSGSDNQPNVANKIGSGERVGSQTDQTNNNPKKPSVDSSYQDGGNDQGVKPSRQNYQHPKNIIPGVKLDAQRVADIEIEIIYSDKSQGSP